MTSRILGLGIITYNRLPQLQSLIVSLYERTARPFYLVIADDGSTDGTVEWARKSGHLIVTSKNRGCAWNKNRALYALLEHSSASIIGLIEDDVTIDASGWEEIWIAATRKWQHVNWAIDEPSQIKYGKGTVQSPFRCFEFGGVATFTTRSALKKIGYLDTRFIRYGAEHLEWTRRFEMYFHNLWGGRIGAAPCLKGNLSSDFSQSWGDEKQFRRNRQVYHQLASEPWYRPWARNAEERRSLLREWKEAYKIYENHHIKGSKALVRWR